MSRKLFTLAAGVSAVLFLATVLLWARTSRRSDYYKAFHAGSRLRPADQRYVVWMHSLWVSSEHGVLNVSRYALDGDTDSARLASGTQERGRESYSEWGTSPNDEGQKAPLPPNRPPERGRTQTLLGWNWMWFWRERYAMDSREDDRGRDWHAPPRVSDDRIRVVEWAAVIPWWVLSPPLAILPSLWTCRRLIARRRRAKGLCLKCGFDLRATPERCPECGAVPAKAKKARHEAEGSSRSQRAKAERDTRFYSASWTQFPRTTT